eukprot:COSAG03_NODE_131_length_11966_cov_5.210163_2_plen_79_part_00
MQEKADLSLIPYRAVLSFVCFCILPATGGSQEGSDGSCPLHGVAPLIALILGSGVWEPQQRTEPALLSEIACRLMRYL